MLDPSPYIRLQCVPMFLFGVLLYFGTEYVLSFVLSAQLDGVHFHMARCSASFFIALPIMFQSWTKSTDVACSTASITSLILFNGFALVATWYARIFAAEFVYSKAIITIMIYLAVMTVFNIYILLKSGWHMGTIQFEADRQFTMNRFFMFDSYGAIFIGFLWMGYPDLLLRRQIRFPLTQHHAYVCRIFGAILASSTIYGNAAVFFKNPSDRTRGLTTRLAVNILVLASQLHSQYAYHQWWTNGHWVGMSLWTLWMGLVVLCLVNVFRGKHK